MTDPDAALVFRIFMSQSAFAPPESLLLQSPQVTPTRMSLAFNGEASEPLQDEREMMTQAVLNNDNEILFNDMKKHYSILKRI
jgi:hypothetical protein